MSHWTQTPHRVPVELPHVRQRRKSRHFWPHWKAPQVHQQSGQQHFSWETLWENFSDSARLQNTDMDALKSAGRAIIRSPSMAKQSWSAGRHRSKTQPQDWLFKRAQHLLFLVSWLSSFKKKYPGTTHRTTSLALPLKYMLVGAVWGCRYFSLRKRRHSAPPKICNFWKRISFLFDVNFRGNRAIWASCPVICKKKNKTKKNLGLPVCFEEFPGIKFILKDGEITQTPASAKHHINFWKLAVAQHNVPFGPFGLFKIDIQVLQDSYLIFNGFMVYVLLPLPTPRPSNPLQPECFWNFG